MSDHIVSLLIAERNKLDAAISALQGKAIGSGTSGGGGGKATVIAATTAPVKRTVSAASRKKMAAAQKARWEKIRAAK